MYDISFQTWTARDIVVNSYFKTDSNATQVFFDECKRIFLFEMAYFVTIADTTKLLLAVF